MDSLPVKVWPAQPFCGLAPLIVLDSLFCGLGSLYVVSIFLMPSPSFSDMCIYVSAWPRERERVLHLSECLLIPRLRAVWCQSCFVSASHEKLPHDAGCYSSFLVYVKTAFNSVVFLSNAIVKGVTERVRCRYFNELLDLRLVPRNVSLFNCFFGIYG